MPNLDDDSAPPMPPSLPNKIATMPQKYQRIVKKINSSVPVQIIYKILLDVILNSTGLTIIGGENSGSLDLGIFVKEVTEDGPADRDGQIYKGDRIISINGQSLEGVSHKVAVEVIQKTSEVVQLILSQPRRNRKSKTRFFRRCILFTSREQFL